MSEAPEFRAGQNIALKVPLFRFEQTLAFYRDVLRLPYLGAQGGSHLFRFGTLRLWLDPVPHQSQVDVWLEVTTADPERGAQHLQRHGVPIRDELEPLGEVRGHWVSDPAGVVLLLTEHPDPEDPDDPAPPVLPAPC